MVKAAMPRSYFGADGRNDRIEVGGDDFGLETEDVAHGAGEIHVVADLGLAVGVEEFRPGRRRVGADGELAVPWSRIQAAVRRWCHPFSTELTS